MVHLLLCIILAYAAAISYAEETQQCTTPETCETKPIIDQHDIIPNDFQQFLTTVEKYELHEMHDSLKEIAAEIGENVGVTTEMQRHVERLLIQDQFPNVEEAAQDPASLKFATFGSLLDVSTVFSASWGGSTEFGGKVSWIGSMFWRNDIIQHEKLVPCRVDLADDYDGSSNSCMHAVTIKDYVCVRGTIDKKYEHMELAASWEILGDKGKGQWRTGKITELEFGNQKFDTIVANGMLAGSEKELQDMDLLLQKVVSLLKPGGIIFLIGTEPSKRVEGPENVINEITDVINSVKTLSGEAPIHNVPATWVNRNLDRLGVNVFSSTLFPAKATYDDVAVTVNDAIEWIHEEFDDGGDETWMRVKDQYTHILEGLLEEVGEVAGDSSIYAGEDQYIIAAKMPLADEKKDDSVPLLQPTNYVTKQKKM